MYEARRLRHFASDNNSGICPEVLAALQEANTGHVTGYGDDPWTEKAKRLIGELFETDCDVFLVFNGTAANALALASLCDSYHSVIAFDYSHVETAECNAPGFFAPGVKLHPVKGVNGKITPEVIEPVAKAHRDVHTSMPRVVSLTQATELGTVYTRDELAAISETARKHGLLVHVDGARFANAVASLGVKPREISWEVGVDVLSFGGTKNGMAFGEVVVFFNKTFSQRFHHRWKQSGQLASKMRFLAAQWIGSLQDGVWLRNAKNANDAAALLETKLRGLPGVKILYPRQVNAVFVEMPKRVIDGLREHGWRFYSHVGPGGARLMCSWDSTAEDVDAFVRDAVELSR
ncbi:MAG TPA: low specificity L-threonine aldolase [Verrucomicrobiae bacterium]|nr:low specificity L-threonine aldolase [Verrucomicrobiae bacterium]